MNKTHYIYLYYVNDKVIYVGQGTTDGGQYARCRNPGGHNEDVEKLWDDPTFYYEIVKKGIKSEDIDALEQYYIIQHGGVDNLLNRRDQISCVEELRNEIARIKKERGFRPTMSAEDFVVMCHNSGKGSIESKGAAVLIGNVVGNNSNVLLVGNEGLGCLHILNDILSKVEKVDFITKGPVKELKKALISQTDES
jgi:hypothetical protein